VQIPNDEAFFFCKCSLSFCPNEEVTLENGSSSSQTTHSFGEAKNE
jgi:hypothetical protein